MASLVLFTGATRTSCPCHMRVVDGWAGCCCSSCRLRVFDVDYGVGFFEIINGWKLSPTWYFGGAGTGAGSSDVRGEASPVEGHGLAEQWTFCRAPS